MTNPDDCDGLASFYSVLRPDSLLDATTLLGQWRTPSLRDVALTAPYMHTGAYETLEDVVAHYNNGGAAGRGNFVGTRDPRIAPLKLSTAEVSDLVAFLRTLNGARLPEAVIATPTLPAPSPF
jgi:cytochrome c peroxidase